MGGKIVAFFVIIGVLFGWISYLPKYPEINYNQSYNQVAKQIFSVVERNLQKASFEYMDDRRKILDMKKDFKTFVLSLSECGKNKNTECLVDKYNDYMDDNVATSLRMMYRYQYVEQNYGKIGVLLNNSFKELY